MSKTELFIVMPLLFCNVFFAFLPNNLLNFIIPIFIYIL
jgi:hypothetical protein